jgi:hypothetical protein
MFKRSAKTEKTLGAHIEALRGMTESKEQLLFEHLYDCLSILDTKSSSLLAFNSMISAVFAIFMLAQLPRCQWIILNIGLASILTSSLLLLLVVWIHWSPPEDLDDLGRYKLTLLKCRDSRTRKYKTAWIFSFLAVVALCFFLGIRFWFGDVCPFWK